MKRPILVAVVGYIIGIIWGLYFKFSIVLLYFIFILTAVLRKILKKYKRPKTKKLKKLNLFSISRYFRYLKLIFNRKVITTIALFSVISNTIVIFKNQKFDNLYKGIQNVEITGVIENLKSESQYKKVYKIKVINLNSFHKQENTKLYVNIDKKYELEYGTIINLKGEFKSPEVARNYGGFCYKDYLKTLGIYGTVNANSVEIINDKSYLNKDNFIANINKCIIKLQEKIAKNAKKYLGEEQYPIFLGLILGDTSDIEENVKEQFRNSNMSHILAVSGMHISYIVVGASIFFSKLFGKKKAKIISILVLFLYSVITGFSPSIIRASIMGIMVLISSLIYRKNDTWTSIALSLFMILVYNPFLITDVGLQFSYAGTVGIILFNKSVLKMLNRGKENKSKIKEMISICVSAQIFILPLTIYHFNSLGIYFLLTNLLLGIVIGPIIITGFIFLILVILDFSIVKFLAIVMNYFINLILLISKLSILPMAKIYIPTPNVLEIVIFYFIVLIINFVYLSINKKNPSTTNVRIKYIKEVFKYKIREKKKKIPIIIAFIVCFICVLYFNIFEGLFNPKLKIHFVDIGQGDCCFIEMPNNKTILIDGGGSEFGQFDVGKSTLLPYILDRGYNKIDYIYISHYDTDHIGGIFTILEELQVGKVFISKQGEESNNYKKFIQIINEKKIKVEIVKKGDKMVLDKDINISILWPLEDEQIKTNVLNNNSIVMKLEYNDFSILFTGDIEKIAEQEILKQIEDKSIFKSTVLKVAHHGSKSSSIQEFLNVVKPKIALIGVGKDNKFGHPNENVLERLEILRM